MLNQVDEQSGHKTQTQCVNSEWNNTETSLCENISFMWSYKEDVSSSASQLNAKQELAKNTRV